MRAYGSIAPRSVPVSEFRICRMGGDCPLLPILLLLVPCSLFLGGGVGTFNLQLSTCNSYPL